MPEFSMKNINKSKKSYTAVSTFSGCGGSSTGVKMAGFKVLYANEFIPEAKKTYEANHVGTFVDDRDIRKVTAKDILKKIGLKKGELDLFEGSPPCSAFSTAGAKEKGWGKEKNYSDGAVQRVDDLFYEYTRLLKGLKPKIFIAENVTGLIAGKAKGYFVEIYKELQSCGYNVKAIVVDASYLGVPQARKRLFFIGVRNDLKMVPVGPKKNKKRSTVNEFLPHIYYIKTKKDGVLKYVPSNIPSPTITASDGVCYETAKFSSGGFVETNTGEKRKYTIDELKVICSFHKDFRLTGNFSQQWERLGRSVPPKMMYAIALAMRKNVLDKLREK